MSLTKEKEYELAEDSYFELLHFFENHSDLDVSEKDENIIWLNAMWKLRGSFYNRAIQIGKIINLLSDVRYTSPRAYRYDIHQEYNQEMYKALITQAKKTYELKVLEVDPITGNPKKYKIIETNQKARS